MIEYKLAKPEDTDRIRTFIKAHWRYDHIFVRDDKFFKFEMAPNGAPQFMLALDQEKLAGIVGFVQYDKTPCASDLFLVILRSLDCYAKDGVGLKLLDACQKLTSKNLHTVGANPRALPLYTLLGFQTGYLDHFVWISPLKASYDIVQQIVPDDWSVPQFPETVRQLSPQEAARLFPKVNQVVAPVKSSWYFQKRYLDHPEYTYQVLGAFDPAGEPDAITGLGVIRYQRYRQSQVIRIIDWIGAEDGFADFGKAVQALCAENGAEGVDLYCKGLPDPLIMQAGFRKAEGAAIFPNYFAPYEAKNIAISFATTSKTSIRLFRGDGDQDRPS